MAFKELHFRIEIKAEFINNFKNCATLLNGPWNNKYLNSMRTVVSTRITTENIIIEKFLEITFKYNTVAINSF